MIEAHGDVEATSDEVELAGVIAGDELAPIRVNVVTPGFVDTDLWSNIPAETRAGMFRDAAAKLPVGRIGTASDVAEHYLSFMRGRYVTGQAIVVDGGGVLV